MFRGDAYTDIEEKIADSGFELDSDFLKIGHHGSRTSTGENFLEAVSPLAAFIPVGKNSYKHPHQEVLDLLEKFNVEIFRADRNGDVKIATDGKTFEILD